MMAIKTFVRFFIALFVLLIVTQIEVLGQSGTDYSDIIGQFQADDAVFWKIRAFQLSSYLFAGLVTIQIIYYGYQFMRGKNFNPGDIPQKIITIFVIYLFLWGAYRLDNIVFAFSAVAEFITGDELLISPMGLLIEGIDTILGVFSVFEDDSLFSRITGGLIFFLTQPYTGLYVIGGVMIVFGYGAMALQYAFITIEAMITIAVSPIPLALGGMEITRGIAESYIKELFNLGFKIFFFHIVFGICRVLLASVSLEIDSSSHFSLGPVMSLGFIACLAVFLLAKLPTKLADRFTSNLNPDFDKLF